MVRNTPRYIQFVNTHKPLIVQALVSYLRQKQSELHHVGKDSADTFERLIAFCSNGKMLRGSLCLLGHRAYTDKNSGAALSAAASLELLQSFLLIHDDIMDKDTMRRGEKTLFTYYAERESGLERMQAEHYGISMAICCGDIAFAGAIGMMDAALAQSDASLDTRHTITSIYTHEVMRVGIAQMDDVAYAINTREPRSHDILALYRNKTGYYSIALPLKIGALFSSAAIDITPLTKIGALIGEIFQLRDDLIGLSNPQASGKSIGSDILNKKRTFMRQYFIEHANRRAKAHLHDIELGTRSVQETVDSYLALLSEHGVLAYIDTLIAEKSELVMQEINALPTINDVGRALLRQFCEYNSTRTV